MGGPGQTNGVPEQHYLAQALSACDAQKDTKGKLTQGADAETLAY